MRKIAILFISLFLMVVPVKALNEVNIDVLLPVNTSNNAVAETFSYDGVYYNTSLDGSGRSTISIGTVRNLTDKKMPLSISIGLFDKDKKNIGVVNYCSTHDMGTDYTYKELRKNETSPLSIKVKTDEHIADKKKIEDVAYFAIFDDNKYCKVGGKDNYVGLTIEQITGGEVANKVEKFLDLEFLRELEIPDFIKNHRNFWMVVGVILLIFLIQADLLNSLHRKMFNKNAGIAYLPIANFYLAVKLTFGPIVAKIYIALMFVSVFLYSTMPILSFIVLFVTAISYFVDLVKLFTKQYNMFYFDKVSFSLFGRKSKLNSAIKSTKSFKKKKDVTGTKNDLIEVMNKQNHNKNTSLLNNMFNNNNSNNVNSSNDISASDRNNNNISTSNIDTTNNFNNATNNISAHSIINNPDINNKINDIKNSVNNGIDVVKGVVTNGIGQLRSFIDSKIGKKNNIANISNNVNTNYNMNNNYSLDDDINTNNVNNNSTNNNDSSNNNSSNNANYNDNGNLNRGSDNNYQDESENNANTSDGNYLDSNNSNNNEGSSLTDLFK